MLDFTCHYLKFTIISDNYWISKPTIKIVTALCVEHQLIVHNGIYVPRIAMAVREIVLGHAHGQVGRRIDGIVDTAFDVFSIMDSH